MNAVVINGEEFFDKVYGCWLGKSIGGTLGAPFEGKRETHNLTFYDPVPKEPAPNDDLDLQLVWLKALEERGIFIDAKVLGEYWLNYIPPDWNEYGIGKANMRKGLLPPISGHFNNNWRDSNGAWIRSEIWACIAPGCPAISARYAFEDACVDHGTSEGVYAEIFTATVESAAFVERDMNQLLQIGLAMVPEGCGVARAVRAAIEAHKTGKDWLSAREAVIAATEDTGWFMAPRNIGFVIIGWLYGGGDFGKSLCAAVNCGDDTDCTGATLGSILGIIKGAKGIPEEWKKPIGDAIKTVAIGNFEPPKTMRELTEKTIRMAKRVLIANNAPVRISEEEPTDLSKVADLRLSDNSEVKKLWHRSPFLIPFDFVHLKATLDYIKDPVIKPGEEAKIKIRLENQTPHQLNVQFRCHLPEGWKAKPQLVQVLTLPPESQEESVAELTLIAPEAIQEVNRCSLEIRAEERPTVGIIPFTFFRATEG